MDPSSPFTGGAILGDRIRMAEIYTDPGVFIRSMATRGTLGGLARASSDAVDVLDAAGFDVILVETVGVGQDEVDIVRAADTTAVVLVPGQGDDIQAIKAGILEIADVFILNKAERDGADRAVAELAMMLDLSAPTGWRPPIVKTVGPFRQRCRGGGRGARRARGSPEAIRRGGPAPVGAGALASARPARGAISPRPSRLRRPRPTASRRRSRPCSRGAKIPIPRRTGSSPGSWGRRRESSPRRPMTAYKIDHLGVAVASIDDALGGLPRARPRSKSSARRSRRRG